MRLRIRDLREDHDKSQTELAKLLNVSQATYSRYESEALDIPVHALDKLANYYNTSVDYLMGRTNQKAPYPKP